MPAMISEVSLIFKQAWEIDNTAKPVFLPAGVYVEPSARGMYTFRLTVTDDDIATLGRQARKSGSACADTDVLIQGDPDPKFTIQRPTSNNPQISNFEDGVSIRIQYTIGDEIASDPAYEHGWKIRCTIRYNQQSLVSYQPRMIVFQVEKVSFERKDHFLWDGIMTEGIAVGNRAYGSFDVELELLDHTGNFTHVAGSIVTESEAIVIDGFRWIYPLKMAALNIQLKGTFMESGHLGTEQTGLHTGIDLGGAPGKPAEIIAVRSGRYSLSHGHWAQLQHDGPHRTLYLHGRNFVPNHGDLVLQGGKIGDMSDNGLPGFIHLHFEHRLYPPGLIRNPLFILPSIKDLQPPAVERIFIREDTGGQCDLRRNARSIPSVAHLIVRCRDRVHSKRDTELDNGPYKVEVRDANSSALLDRIEFNEISIAELPPNRPTWRHFYPVQSVYVPENPSAQNHYLPFLRLDTAPYGQAVSPIRLEVRVSDFMGGVNLQVVSIGPDVESYPNLVLANSDFEITIKNCTNNIYDNDTRAGEAMPIIVDDFHILLADDAPAGWSLSRIRSGDIGNSASKTVTLQINTNGSFAPGEYELHLIVHSNILLQVGQHLPITVRVDP